MLDEHRMSSEGRMRLNPGTLRMVRTDVTCPRCGPISVRKLHRGGCPYLGMSQREIAQARVPWADMDRCDVCGASAGEPCTDMRRIYGAFFLRAPHPGRKRQVD